MSVTITITDPTKDEALRVADYLYDLAGYGRNVADEGPGDVVTMGGTTLQVDTAAVFGSAATSGPIADNLATLPVGATASTQELDSAGLPWDARIHASSRAKIADGTWCMKRGVDDATVAAVTAELKGATLIAGVEKEIDAPQPVDAQLGAAGAQLVAPPPPPPADLTFPTLLQRVTAAKIAPEKVLQAVQAQGLPSLPMLATRPDLLPAVAAALGV